MSQRFIKFIPGPEAEWLISNKPNAFLLLTIIAQRARRMNGNPDGLTIGQAHIGDWKACGLTEQEYRTAKEILLSRKYIKIVETCRTRKKSTTGTTTKGTLVQLICNTIYDINIICDNDRINDRATTDQRPTNDEQERIRKKEIDDDDDRIIPLRVKEQPSAEQLAKQELEALGYSSKEIAIAFKKKEGYDVSDSGLITYLMKIMDNNRRKGDAIGKRKPAVKRNGSTGKQSVVSESDDWLGNATCYDPHA